MAFAAASPVGTIECFLFNVTSDTMIEGDETFKVFLSSPDSVLIAIGPNNMANVTILDDDCKFSKLM